MQSHVASVSASTHYVVYACYQRIKQLSRPYMPSSSLSLATLSTRACARAFMYKHCGQACESDIHDPAQDSCCRKKKPPGQVEQVRCLRELQHIPHPVHDVQEALR